MTSNLSILLLGSDTSTRNDIVAVLKSYGIMVGKVTVAADVQEGIRIAQSGEPHIVFLEVREIEQGVRDIALLVARFPQATVIAVAAEKNPDWILRLIRAGAAEYLTKPVAAVELVAAVHKAARLQAQSQEPADNPGSVIAVYNPSGGMGTTSIAVNLAASLATAGESVALVDLNLFSGDVTTFLDLAPRYTLANVTTRWGQVDASFLKSVMVPHASGIQVLCGPTDLEEADGVQPEQLGDVIALLKKTFTYTVIDTGGRLSGCNMATFERSDLILFVTLLNLPALKNAKRYLAAMNGAGLGSDRVKLVINRHIAKDEIKVSDAEKILNTRVYLTVPNAYQDIKTAINRGVPLVVSNPRSPVTRAMEGLARQVILDATGGTVSGSGR
jgi:pilus assembly protein CpaE